MATVELEKVHKNYGAPQDAVKGISFTCQDGEFLVLLGPSGCGKTTTLRMITGLETITKGIIKIDGKVVNDLTPQQRNVAMAFETYALYPPLTVFENIAFPLHVMGLPKEEVDRQVRKVAEGLSISDILDNMPDSLAGGQKQRVSLARALVRDPTVFLMDEPLSHVDADVRHRARAEIKHVQATTKATVIYVTHDQVEAVALADRVVVMDLGVLQQIGTPMELYYRPANLFVAGFIGEPPMNTVECKLHIGGGDLAFTWLGDGQVTLRFSITDVDPDSLKALEPYNGRQVVAGIRPQRLVIRPPVSSPQPGVLPGKLLVHEFLGREGIVQVQVDNKVMECVTAPEIPFAPGDNVGLSVTFDDIHIFDPDSQCRIEHQVELNGNLSA
jgi:multiple sugar transport system ATP-binding protein